MPASPMLLGLMVQLPRGALMATKNWKESIGVLYCNGEKLDNRSVPMGRRTRQKNSDQESWECLVRQLGNESSSGHQSSSFTVFQVIARRQGTMSGKGTVFSCTGEHTYPLGVLYRCLPLRNIPKVLFFPLSLFFPFVTNKRMSHST